MTEAAPETNSPAKPSVAQSPSTSSESAAASQPAAPETTSASTVASDQNQAEQQPAASETTRPSTVASSQSQAEQQPVAQTSAPEKASTGTAPTKASLPTLAGASSRRLWIVGGLLLAAVVLIAVAILPAVRRRYKLSVPGSSQPESGADTAVLKARTAPATRLVFKATASPADHVRSHLNLKHGILRSGPALWRCRKLAVLLIG